MLLPACRDTWPSTYFPCQRASGFTLPYLWERCHTHHLQLFLFATIALVLLKCSNTLDRSWHFVLRAFIVVAIMRLRLTGFGAQGYVPGALVVCLPVECSFTRLRMNCITEKWIIIVPSQSSLHKCQWRVSEGQNSWFCDRQYVCNAHDLLLATVLAPMVEGNCTVVVRTTGPEGPSGPPGVKGVPIV